MLGEDHRSRPGYNNLASTWRPGQVSPRHGRFTARPWPSSRKCWARSTRTRPPSYNNLASNLAPRASMPRPSTVFRKALAIRQKVLGEEHPDTAAATTTWPQPERPGQVRRRREPAVPQGPGHQRESAGRATPRHSRELQLPGLQSDRSGQIRRGRDALSPGSGDPPEGAGRESPRHGRKLQQPGLELERPGQVCRGGAVLDTCR